MFWLDALDVLMGYMGLGGAGPAPFVSDGMDSLDVGVLAVGSAATLDIAQGDRSGARRESCPNDVQTGERHRREGPALILQRHHA